MNIATQFRPELNARQDQIRKSKRTDTYICREATKKIKANIRKVTETLKRCTTPDDLERAYEKFKQTILSPWESTKRKIPGRLKNFWTKNLDRMAKIRKKRYEKATRSQNDKYWRDYKEIDGEI